MAAETRPRLLDARMPGVMNQFDCHGQDVSQRLQRELVAMRHPVELSDRIGNELLTVNVTAIWRKRPIE